MAQLSKRSIDTLKGVHPDLVKVITKAIKETPVDFTVVQGVRTVEEQKALYAQGRTTKGSVVTNADGVKKKSNHQVKSDGYGHAVDLYPFIDGKVDVNDSKNQLPVLAKHILKTAKSLGVNVEWGGNWKFVDKPHFELK